MKNLNLFNTKKQLLKHLVNHGDIVCSVIYDKYENVVLQYPINKIISIGCCDAIIIKHTNHDKCEPKETLLTLKILAKAELVIQKGLNCEI